MPSDLRQEPSAVIPRAGICAGGAGSTGVPTANEYEKQQPGRPGRAPRLVASRPQGVS